MAAAPRGVEAHSLLGGSYPLMTDAVEKVGATLTTRNNRIAQAGFLNRSCAFDARLESILREDPSKSFFDSIGHKATFGHSKIVRRNRPRSAGSALVPSRAGAYPDAMTIGQAKVAEAGPVPRMPFGIRSLQMSH